MVEIPPNIENHLTAIRDRELPTGPFREHSLILADWLTDRLLDKIPGHQLKDIVPIVIFRASLVFMPSILKKLTNSSVGFIGLRRDEQTAIAELYYINLPKIYKNSRVAIVDPMLGTCGTLIRAYEEVAKKLKEDSGGEVLKRENVYYAGFLAAESGYRKALNYIPKDNITLLAVDPELDANNFIYPGLGDFGDRFCGD